MTVLRKRPADTRREALERHFQGAVIDENGREIPITRDMIKRACRALDDTLTPPSSRGERRQHLS